MGYRKVRGFYKRRLFRVLLGAGTILGCALVLVFFISRGSPAEELLESSSARMNYGEWQVVRNVMGRTAKDISDLRELFAEFRGQTGWSRQQCFNKARAYVRDIDFSLDELTDLSCEYLQQTDFVKETVFQEVARALTPEERGALVQ